MEKYIVCDLYRMMMKKGIRTVSELQRITKLTRRTLDKSFYNTSTQINHNTALILCEALGCDFHELYKMVDKGEYEDIMKTLWHQQEYLDKGYVYFVKQLDYGFVKIGKTSDLNTRLKQLKKEFGNIKLLHFIESENAIELEKQFHKKFTENRSEREWFNLSDEEIDSIINGNPKEECF